MFTVRRHEFNKNSLSLSVAGGGVRVRGAGSGFRVQSSAFRVQGSGFGVQGSTVLPERAHLRGGERPLARVELVRPLCVGFRVSGGWISGFRGVDLGFRGCGFRV